ncbi:eukaryotic translation initiation factor 3 subunit A [Manduca sexta]|nr:eukaryotic translation initiation factor 3 subunit A [Manduca sexta]
MIGNLQETVSQLVYLKKDAKKLKEEIMSRDKAILAMEKDRESIYGNHRKHIMDLQNTHEKEIEELKIHNETTVKQLHYESDTQIAQFTCTIEELRTKLRDVETEHKEKINVVVLEYEEKIQRSEFQVTQLQEQLARETARADANIDAYHRRLEELEEKLKQTQFKHYLAHRTYPSQYESQVERPYSVERDYAEPNFVNLDSTVEATKRKGVPSSSQNKTPRTNTLQVMYYGSNSNLSKATEKKGSFHITKKRKLYNEKDFINM